MGRYSKQKLAEMVYSEDAEQRMIAARNGYGLGVLVGDRNSGVRAKVAEQGFGLDTLVNDPYWWVRCCVAEQGYGLDKLLHDEDWMVRATVAEQGYGLDVLMHDPDPGVRGAVAREGHGLDVLVNDPDFGVRRCVARQGYGLDWLAKAPDKRVRMEVKDVLSAMRRYSKYSTEDLMQMIEGGWHSYRERASTSKKLDPVQAEALANKYNAILGEINRRKVASAKTDPSLDNMIESVSARAGESRSTTCQAAKEAEPTR